LYVSGDLSIVDNQFSGKASDGRITVFGKFSSGTSGSGYYSLDYYLNECAAYFSTDQTWSAAPSGSTVSAAAQTRGQHEIYKDNMLIVIE
jgi:hypothetical protein